MNRRLTIIGVLLMMTGSFLVGAWISHRSFGHNDASGGSNTNFKSRRYLRWLVFGSSTYVGVRLRRLNPRHLDFILDLKLV